MKTRPGRANRRTGGPGWSIRAGLGWLFAACLAPGPAAAAIQTQYVVIVSIDGGRYSETLGHPTLAYHPRIGYDMAAIGARPTRFENIGVTNTNPGHSALVTGTLQPIANDGSERPHKPTIFEYLRKHKGTPQSLLRLYLRKAKLDVLAHSDHPDYGAAYGAATPTSHASDLAVFTAARAGILATRPVASLVHFGDPDLEGHANDWPGYLTALRLADSLTWQLWTAIQADPVMGGKTTMLISNDHGRHLDGFGGFQNHGDGCDGCRRILLMMVGPDNRVGFVGAGTHEQRAVARTAGWLLQVAMPLADGVVMDELLLEPSGPIVGVTPPRSGAGDLAVDVFPNPAFTGVAVRVRGPVSRTAGIEIVDAAGRRVATATPASSASATREWWWNGLDQRGRRAPPGTYLVRVLDGRAVRTARVTLLR